MIDIGYTNNDDNKNDPNSIDNNPVIFFQVKRTVW